MHVSPACVFTMYVPGTHRGQKEAPNPLELGIPDACEMPRGEERGKEVNSELKGRPKLVPAGKEIS